jgi:hypothetical protein
VLALPDSVAGWIDDGVDVHMLSREGAGRAKRDPDIVSVRDFDSVAMGGCF